MLSRLWQRLRALLLTRSRSSGATASSNSDRAVGNLALDNVVAQALTWLDVAIVFGPSIPLVVPLVFLALCTNHWMIGLGRSRFGVHVVGEEQGAPSVAYIGVSVIVQQGLTAWSFFGSNLAGKDLAATSCALAVFAVTVLMVATKEQLQRVYANGGRYFSRGRDRGRESITEMRASFATDGDRQGRHEPLLAAGGT